MAFGLQSTNNSDKRESLLSILKDVSPNTDNYFVSNMAVGPDATNTIHEWGVYNTARPTSVTTVIEGAAASYADLTAPEKSNNRLSTVDETVRVSTVQEGISTITGEDPMAFQKNRALIRLKAKMEFLTINGAYASGASGVASVAAGFDQMISTNVTARASGTSFSEIELNDMMQQSWTEVGSEYVADLLVCPIVVKRRISTFSTNLTRNINASEKKLSQDIRVYDSDVGKTVMIIPHKDVRALAGSLTVYALREDLLAHSFLANVGRPAWTELAQDGHRKNGMYASTFTVVNYAQRAMVKRTGYATTL